jgi:hypothetical protein
VKLAPARLTDRRNNMRERQRRDRAATQLMRDRYPQIASLRLDFDFSDSGPFTPAPQVTVLHPPARTYFFFPCPYADCDGEFDLTEAVTRLMREDETHAGGQLTCCGQRTREKQQHSPCQLMLEYTIVAQRL